MNVEKKNNIFARLSQEQVLSLQNGFEELINKGTVEMKVDIVNISKKCNWKN
ncbi:hypothetical protein [Sporosarcina beigongshangi]|uniref:hypothetical protein n=1 Tax=Sporosarcina beigongshangi TaxID=2782538 RepID=UPI001939947D|nr:hypothetical protein [Sporosarcina beigongshangi]